MGTLRIDNIIPQTGSGVILAGDLTVNGILTVVGAIDDVTINDLVVADQTITANAGGTDATAENAGLIIERTGAFGQVLYDSALASKWKVGNVGAMYEVLVSGVAQTIAGAKSFADTVALGTANATPYTSYHTISRNFSVNEQTVATDANGGIAIIANAYTGNAAYQNTRLTGLGGGALFILPRTTDSSASLEYRTNLAANGVTASATTKFAITQEGATIWGPNGAGSLTHLINGSNVTQRSATFAQYQIDAASGADALLLFSEDNGNAGQWAIGKDNSNSDALDFSAGATLGSNSVGIVSRAGGWLFGNSTANVQHVAEANTANEAGAFRARNYSTLDAAPAGSYLTAATTNSTANKIVNFVRGTIGQGAIGFDGTTGVTFTSYSDARLKTNFRTAPTQLDKVLGLNICLFDMKDGSAKNCFGATAQNIQEFFPEHVAADPDGLLEVGGWGIVEYRLAKAIQELNAKIEALAA